MKRFKNKIGFLKKTVLPSTEFRRKIKSNLIKKIIKDEPKVKFFKQIDLLSPSRNENSLLSNNLKRKKTFKSRLIKASVVLTACLIFLLIIFSKPTSAENKTFFSNITGIVQFSNNSIFKEAQVGDILENGSTVRTDKSSSAEIVFFEDSVLRLEENSKIAIKKLLPDPRIKEVGSVTVELEFGKAWIKSFGGGFSEFKVHCADAVIFPQNGTFDLLRDGNFTKIRVFDRSIKISHRGERDRGMFSLIKDRQVIVSLIGVGEIEKIKDWEKGEEWIKRNLFLDKNYIENFISKKIEIKGGLKNVLNSLTPSSAEELLQMAENNFRNAIKLLREDQKKEAEKELVKFLENIKNAIEKDASMKEVAKVMLENESKFLQFTLPQEKLFMAKNILEKGKELVAENLRTQKEKNITERLWEAKKFAENQENNLAQNNLKNFTKEIKNIPFQSNKEEKNSSPEIKIKILEEKSEQLEILLDLAEDIPEEKNKGDISSAENEVIIDVIEIIENKKIDEKAIKEKKNSSMKSLFKEDIKIETPQELAQRVKIYKTPRGQENATREILKNIKNNSDSLLKLKEFRSNIPKNYNLHKMITDKMLEIIREEKRKAILETG